MYITKEDLIAFTGKVPKADDDLPEKYCKSAVEEVNRYLGYNPELAEYTTEKRGDGGKLLELKSKPIVTIISAEISGVEVETTAFNIIEDSNMIEFNNQDVFCSSVKYKLTYKAGYSEVPEIIKTTALQIATLFWESAKGNLAVSSTSFADTGSRVFNNFTADRFLKQIESYRLIKF